MARDMYAIVERAKKNRTIDPRYDMIGAEMIHLCARCDSIDDRLEVINTCFVYGYCMGLKAANSKRKRKRRINAAAVKDFAIVSAVTVAGVYIWLQILLGIIGI